MKNINQTSGAAALFQFFCRDKEHAALSAFASVAHGVEVKTTEDHVNRAADKGCCVSSCWALTFLIGPPPSWLRIPTLQ